MSGDGLETGVALSRCPGCGRKGDPCARVRLATGEWCPECLEKATRAWIGQSSPAWRSSPLLAAVFSIIPGVGHMSLGLLEKGAALLGGLIGGVLLTLLVSDLSGVYWLTALLVPALSVLFLTYSLFDAVTIAGEYRAGDYGRADERAVDDAMLGPIIRFAATRRALVGWVLLAVGLLGVARLFDAPIRAAFRSLFGTDLSAGGLILPLLLVVAGLTLLRRRHRDG